MTVPAAAQTPADPAAAPAPVAGTGTANGTPGSGSAPGANGQTDPVRAAHNAAVKQAEKYGNDPVRIAKRWLKERAQDRAAAEQADQTTRELRTTLKRYEALGTPEQVEALAAQVRTLTGKEAERERETAARAVAAKAAAVLGMDPDLLYDFAKEKGLPLAVTDTPVANADGTPGTPARVVEVVRGTGAQATRERFDALLARDFPKYATALRATAADPNGTVAAAPATGTAPVAFPAQHPSTGAAPQGDLAAQYIQTLNAANAARPNPFAPLSTNGTK